MNANYDLDDQQTLTDLSLDKTYPCKVLSAWFKVKDLQPHIKSCSVVLKKFEASPRMGIYEDRQIHTKTSFRPIKLQEADPALILIERHLIIKMT